MMLDSTFLTAAILNASCQAILNASCQMQKIYFQNNATPRLNLKSKIPNKVLVLNCFQLNFNMIQCLVLHDARLNLLPISYIIYSLVRLVLPNTEMLISRLRSIQLLLRDRMRNQEP